MSTKAILDSLTGNGGGGSFIGDYAEFLARGAGRMTEDYAALLAEALMNPTTTLAGINPFADPNARRTAAEQILQGGQQRAERTGRWLSGEWSPGAKDIAGSAGETVANAIPDVVAGTLEDPSLQLALGVLPAAGGALSKMGRASRALSAEDQIYAAFARQNPGYSAGPQLAGPKPLGAQMGGKQRGMFAGEKAIENLKKNNETIMTSHGPRTGAELDAALKNAQKLMKSQESPGLIWGQTGFTLGKDGKWRFEIDDTGATWDHGLEGERKFSEYFQHPEAEKAYPGILDRPAELDPELSGASFNSLTGKIIIGGKGNDQAGSAIHELTHAGQHEEGFSSGTSSHHVRNMAVQQILDSLQGVHKKVVDAGLKPAFSMSEIQKRMSESKLTNTDVEHYLNQQKFNIAASGMTMMDAADMIGPEQKQIIDALSDVRHPLIKYRRNAGETEARNADNRYYEALRHKNAKERGYMSDLFGIDKSFYELHPPHTTADVPISLQWHGLEGHMRSKEPDVQPKPTIPLDPRDFSQMRTAPKKVGGEVKPAHKRALAEFEKVQNEVRSAMSPTDKASVDPFVANQFGPGTVFLSPDRNAGFAMDDTGYLSHAFNAPNSPWRGVMDAIIRRGRAEGARTLSAFDFRRNPNAGSLAEAYQKRGAVEVKRHPWDPSQATQEIIDAFKGQNPAFVDMKIGGVFDLYEDSKILGPRAQFDLPRYTTTKSGKVVQEPATVGMVFSPGNIAHMKNLIRRGMMDEGEKWYFMGAVMDAYIDELGVTRGMQEFDKAMDIGSMMSPLSEPYVENMRASVIRKRIKDGKPVTDLDNSMFPTGYGHFATVKSHRDGLNRWLQNGSVGDPLNPAKTPSYAQNKKGNMRPFTIDTKMLQGMYMNTPLAGRESISAPEYRYMEPKFQDLAAEFGLKPAAGQAAQWIGTAAEQYDMGMPRGFSGMERKPLAEIINQNIAKTSVEDGLPEEEVMKKWIRSEIILKSLLGGVGTGILANSFTGSEEESN